MKLNEELIQKIKSLQHEVNSTQELAEKCEVSRMSMMKYCKLLDIKIKTKIKVRNKKSSQSYALKDILEGKYPQYPTSKLRKRLIVEGYKNNECEICGLKGIWNNKPISLQVDHVDGNRINHKLENLRLLCPNCHSQTETYGAKNIT